MGKVLLAVAGKFSGEDVKGIPADARLFYCGVDIQRYYAVRNILGGNCPDAVEGKDLEEKVFAQGRRRYIEFIDSLIIANKDNDAVWIDDQLGKNTFAPDSYYLEFCCLAYLERAVTDGFQNDFLAVFEDSQVLDIARSLLLSKGVECVTVGQTAPGRAPRWKREPPAVARYLFWVAHSLLIWIAARFIVPALKEAKGGKEFDILLRTYLMEKDVKPGVFNDRYLPGFAQWARGKNRSVAIYPVLHKPSLRTIVRTLQMFRSGGDNHFILMEDYLTIPDYVRAALYPLRALSSDWFTGRMPDTWERKLILCRRNHSPYSLMAYQALLFKSVPRRMKEWKLNFRRYVIWTENQVIQKADIIGFKEQYPEAKVVGAEMSIPPVNFVNMYYTRADEEIGAAPDVLLVPGKAFYDVYSQYMARTPCDTAPSTRYSYLWDMAEKDAHGKEGEGNALNILITLPQSMDIALNVLKIVVPALAAFSARQVNVKIKPHPTTMSGDVIVLARTNGLTIEGKNFVSESLADLQGEADLVISSQSGSILEAICIGCPVLAVVMPIGIDYSPYLPADARAMCRVVSDAGSVSRAVVEIIEGRMSTAERRRRAVVGKIILAECVEKGDDFSKMKYLL